VFTGKEGEYSIEDYIQNGKYCESGLAYNSDVDEAKCSATNRVSHTSNPTVSIADPYVCSPMNPNEKCKLEFEIQKTDTKDDKVFVKASGALKRDHV